MEKPTILLIEETKKSIIDNITSSGLPDFILLPIIKDIYELVNNSCKQSYENEKKSYEENLLTENK